jgi:hypothetical protein
VCLGLRWTAKKRVGWRFCAPRCTQCLKLPAKTIQTCILLTADQVARRGRPRALATCLTSNPPLSNSRNSDRETRTGDKVSSISPHFTPKSKQIDRTLCLTSPNLHPKTQPNLKSSPQSSPYPESLKIHAPQQTLFPPPAPVISPCDVPPSVVAMIRGQGMAAALLWLIHTQDTRVCKLSKRAGAPGGVMYVCLDRRVAMFGDESVAHVL